MSAVDEIKAAIDKLTAMSGLIDGPVIRWRDQEHIPGWDGFIVIGDDVEEDEECNPVARVYTPELAELIVTLHRTINAQLTALRMAVDYLANGFHEDSGVPQIGIGTARAINGVTS